MSNWQDLPDETGQPQTTTPRGGNAWIDLPSVNVRPAAIAALTANPDRTAQDAVLAGRYKTTPSLVGAARATFEERAAADDAAKIMLGTPRLSGWFTMAPENAALAKDDLQNSADLERLLGGRSPADYLRRPQFPMPEIAFTKKDGSTWERTKRAWQEGQVGNRIATHGFLQMPLDGLSEMFPSIFGGLAEANREEIQGYREWLKDTPYTSASGGARVWEDFVRSSPLMATQISLGLLSGGVAVPTTFMGTQISGSQYADLTADGVNGGRAFFAALGNTAMQLPLEAVQLNRFMNIFKGSGLGQIARRVGESALTSFVTETLQNYPDALTTLWAQSTRTGQNPMSQFLNNLGQYTLDGMYEGVLSVPWALLGGSGRIAYDIGRYRTLNRDVEFFNALDGNAAASKIKARLPQAYQSLVDHMTAGGAVQSLYISPAAMREAIADEDVLYQTVNDMGVSREAFNRAEELGADLEVPLNLYQGKIAGTEVSLALRGEVRTSPEGMTLNEQATFAENFRQQVESAVSEYRDSLLQDDELNASLAPIESELAKIYGKEGARANVALLRARANIAAQGWREAGRDITPAQWIADVAKLSVAVEEWGQGEAGDLQQAAMYRNQAASIGDFLVEVESGANTSNKSYFDFGGYRIGRNEYSGYGLHLGEDQVRHINERHPEFSAWERIPDIIDLGRTEYIGKNSTTGGDSYAFVLRQGDTSMVVLGSPMEGKKAGKRIIVLTAFEDSTKAVENWVARQKKNAPSSQSAGGSPAYPSPQRSALSGHEGDGSVEKIAPGEEGVNGEGDSAKGENARGSMERNAAHGLAAMNRVIADKTDALDAMYRDDVGSISFYWGSPGRGKKFKDGAGISHIIAKHGEEVARKMPEVLAYGTKLQEQTAERGTRVLIAHENYTAVLSLYKFGNRETWLLTGWDEGASIPGVTSGTSTSAGNAVLSLGGRAVTPSEIDQSIPLLGSDGKILFHGAESAGARLHLLP